MLIGNFTIGDVLEFGTQSGQSKKSEMFANLHDIGLDLIARLRIERNSIEGIRTENYECKRNVATIVVWYTDDTRVHDFRMTEQTTLDFSRCHLEASHFEQLLK
jgi:hypothetical protein